MSLGAFADGLFGGISSALEIRGKLLNLKQMQRESDQADALYKKNEEDIAAGKNKAGQPGIGKEEYIEPPPASQKIGNPTDITGNLNNKPSLADDPELKKLPLPKYMEGIPGASKKPPNYLPRSVMNAPEFDTPSTPMTAKSASAADAPAPPMTTKSATAADAPALPVDTTKAPGGQLGLSFIGGLHSTQPGEPSLATGLGNATTAAGDTTMTEGGAASAVGGALGATAGQLRFSPTQGLYNPNSSVGQQISRQQSAPASTSAIPTNQAPPVYLPSAQPDRTKGIQKNTSRYGTVRKRQPQTSGNGYE